jgi:uncharacterized protein (DUF58 family)
MMTPARTHRIAALVVPGPVIALVANGTHGMMQGASLALLVLWITMFGGIVSLALDARKTRSSVAASIDILTPSGAAAMWTSAFAMILSAGVGWASLAVIGVLGMGTVCLAATWLALVTGSDVPWKRATVERTIVPALAIEGELLREVLRLDKVRIPPGMRLFVRGSALPHRPESRYVIDGIHSGAQLELASDLGPAPRGEHCVPPLALWLGDVLGLVRSVTVYRGETELVVLPRPVAVDHVKRLFGSDGDDAHSVPVHVLPTEGSFRMREYAPGDDTRRIHWVRSLQQDRLIVRLPDEVPAGEPTIRVVLDNDMMGGDALGSEAAAQMLDALVRVWLGVGEALVKSGAKVTLATAIDGKPVERAMTGPATRDAMLRMAARVTWQSVRSLDAILDAGKAARQVIVSCRPRRLQAHDRDAWIIVPDIAWTHSDPQLLPPESGLRYPFPAGAPENRPRRRERARAAARARWEERSTFGQITCWVDWTRFSGDIVARPMHGRAVLQVIP